MQQSVQPRQKEYTYLSTLSSKQKSTKSDPFDYIRDDTIIILERLRYTGAMVLLKFSSIDPTLSEWAMKVLPIPAASAPVELVFSQGPFLFCQHGASMTRTTLQQVMMLKCNHGLYCIYALWYYFYQASSIFSLLFL